MNSSALTWADWLRTTRKYWGMYTTHNAAAALGKPRPSRNASTTESSSTGRV